MQCGSVLCAKVGQHMQKRHEYSMQCACDQCVMEKWTVHAHSVQT